MQTPSESPSKPAKRRPSKLLVIVGGVLALLCICAFVAALSGNKGKGTATPEPTTVVAKVEATAAAPQPATTKAPATAAPTVAPKPTTTPVPVLLAKAGERVESGGVALTVVKVSKSTKIDDLWTAKDGNTYVICEVIVESVTRDDAPYNPLYFKVKDSDGIEANSAMVAPEPSLKTGKLAKGEKARGNVAFEMATSSKGLVLSYEPMVILGGYKVIRIDLGQ